MNARTHVLPIRTPEGIVFAQTLASPIARFMAWAIDLLCLLAVLAPLNALLATLRVVSADLAQALSLLLFFALSLGYGMILEWHWRGQTVGKKLFRLRVVDAQGLRLQFDQIVIRNLVRAVDILPVFYLVGGLACLLSRRAQRLGDIAANTVVIRMPRLAQPDLDQISAGKFNSLLAYPHLAARLRQRVTPPEAAVALQAIVRRNTLEPAARVALFQELAALFRAKAPFPPEALEGLTDEQYVRNVTEALYRPRPGADTAAGRGLRESNHGIE